MTEGYGIFCPGERARILAHRYSFKLANETLPDDLCVLHRCDNPPCVRPDHLFLGTRDDNARDRDEKGRGWWNRGFVRPNAKIVDVETVNKLITAGWSQESIGRELGVSQALVSRVARGVHWSLI